MGVRVRVFYIIFKVPCGNYNPFYIRAGIGAREAR
jgi:hypothetical protein